MDARKPRFRRGEALPLSELSSKEGPSESADAGFDITARRLRDGRLACIQCKRLSGTLHLFMIGPEVAKVALRSKLEGSSVVEHYVVTSSRVDVRRPAGTPGRGGARCRFDGDRVRRDSRRTRRLVRSRPRATTRPRLGRACARRGGVRMSRRSSREPSRACCRNLQRCGDGGARRRCNLGPRMTSNCSRPFRECFPRPHKWQISRRAPFYRRSYRST